MSALRGQQCGDNTLTVLRPITLGLAALALVACTAAKPTSPSAEPSPLATLAGTSAVASQPFPDAQASPDWRLVEALGFSLRLPAGWELNELQGIDSYVGEVAGGGVRLTFDYGLHAWTLNPADDPEHSYVVTYETIGGHEAKLLLPVDASKGGFTGVYFAELGGPKLTLFGQNLTADQQRTVIAIFRSIRRLGQ